MENNYLCNRRVILSRKIRWYIIFSENFSIKYKAEVI